MFCLFVFIAAVYIPCDAHFTNSLQDCTNVFVLFVIGCVTNGIQLNGVVHARVI